MEPIRAVVIGPKAPERFVIGRAEAPLPGPSEVLVRVAVASLNLGELRRSMTARAGSRPGWDFAGTIERAATDGSGPPAGARVVGLLISGAWAEGVPHPRIEMEAPWTEIASITHRFYNRGIAGKAVLHF